jgi:hypothetical protein
MRNFLKRVRQLLEELDKLKTPTIMLMLSVAEVWFFYSLIAASHS